MVRGPEDLAPLVLEDSALVSFCVVSGFIVLGISCPQATNIQRGVVETRVTEGVNGGEAAIILPFIWSLDDVETLFLRAVTDFRQLAVAEDGGCYKDRTQLYPVQSERSSGSLSIVSSV
jgi:hypothetical protein